MDILLHEGQENLPWSQENRRGGEENRDNLRCSHQMGFETNGA